MAWFTAKEWKNRLVEFAGRRSLKNVSTNETTVYDVTRNEGQVSQEGDAFSATNMNEFEQRVQDGFDTAEESFTQLSSEMASMKTSFQAGVDTIYNKMVSCGETPSSKSPTDIANKIQQMYDGRYSTGYSIGYNEGRAQGQNDVKGNPNNYGLYSKNQYDQNYNNGYNAGFSAGEATFSGEIDLLLNGSIGSNNATITYNLGQYTGYKAIFLAAYYPSTLTFSNPQNVNADIKSNGQLDTACFTDIKSNSTFQIYKYGTGNVNAIMYGIK